MVMAQTLARQYAIPPHFNPCEYVFSSERSERIKSRTLVPDIKDRCGKSRTDGHLINVGFCLCWVSADVLLCWRRAWHVFTSRLSWQRLYCVCERLGCVLTLSVVFVFNWHYISRNNSSLGSEPVCSRTFQPFNLSLWYCAVSCKVLYWTEKWSLPLLFRQCTGTQPDCVQWQNYYKYFERCVVKHFLKVTKVAYQ